LAEALADTQRSLRQTQLFLATLFLTMAVKFDFPLENCSEEERADIHEMLVVHANDMLALATSPPRRRPPNTNRRPTALARLTAARELSNQPP
jgi:hypothetical protein